MVGKAEIKVVAGERLAVVLGRERRALAELIEGIARRDIKRPVEVNQGAVEIEKDGLETTSQTIARL